MAQPFEGRIDIREDLSRTFKIDDHLRDLSSESVKMYVTDLNGKTHVAGATQGTPQGKEFLLACTFDQDPGVYEAEIGVDGGAVLYPQNEDRPTIFIHDTRYDN